MRDTERSNTSREATRLCEVGKSSPSGPVASTLNETRHPTSTLLGMETKDGSRSDSVEFVSPPTLLGNGSKEEAAPQNLVHGSSSAAQKKAQEKKNECLSECIHIRMHQIRLLHQIRLMNLSPEEEEFLKKYVRAIDAEFVQPSGKICWLVIYNGVGELLENLHLEPHGGVTEKEWIGPQVADDKPRISFDKAKKILEKELHGRLIVGHNVQGDLKKMKIEVNKNQLRDTATNTPMNKIILQIPDGKIIPQVALQTAMSYYETEIQTPTHCAHEDTLSSLFLYIEWRESWEKLLKKRQQCKYWQPSEQTVYDNEVQSTTMDKSTAQTMLESFDSFNQSERITVNTVPVSDQVIAIQPGQVDSVPSDIGERTISPTRKQVASRPDDIPHSRSTLILIEPRNGTRIDSGDRSLGCINTGNQEESKPRAGDLAGLTGATGEQIAQTSFDRESSEMKPVPGGTAPMLSGPGFGRREEGDPPQRAPADSLIRSHDNGND